MKNFLIQLIFVFGMIIVSATVQAAGACKNPDFSSIMNSLRAARTQAAAIELRRQTVARICDLEGFAKLIELEQNEPGAHFFGSYKQYLGDFVIENVGSFVAGRKFSDFQSLYSSSLIRKMVTSEQEIQLRLRLLPTVSSCQEFQALTYPWNESLDSNLARLLSQMKMTYGSQFCSSEALKIYAQSQVSQTPKVVVTQSASHANQTMMCQCQNSHPNREPYKNFTGRLQFPVGTSYDRIKQICAHDHFSDVGTSFVSVDCF